MSGKFLRVTFPRVYPASEVSDHEVLMQFSQDDDAAMFRDWWAEKGSNLFASWYEKNKRKESNEKGGNL